ncbi:excisionase family DNA-binding protein [Nocardia brasiliensis]|uniref:Excisionase family DNA-binding protein n=2 Tax=Nocardia brasiliensis TaxID=37326 RepID=A0A6G9XNA6_NOCBR|nr:excisionase family DNA-binding protein [Nocardia brasiliensis]
MAVYRESGRDMAHRCPIFWPFLGLIAERACLGRTFRISQEASMTLNLPASPVPEDLITVRTAASLVDVDAKTIKNWIKAGDLEGWLVNGSRWRVRRAAVLALVQLASVSGVGGDSK